MISLIDTHAHYNSADLENLNNEIISINSNKVISNIINVGIDYGISKDTIDISLNNSKFYSTIGVHPLKEGSIEVLNYLCDNCDLRRVVAIGETGIDTNGNVDEQIKKLIASIILANKMKLPVIIHSNTTKNFNIDANKLCIEIIKKCKPQYGFVFHCFQPNLEDLNEILKLGGYISIGPMILKKNAKKSLDVVRNVSINSLLIETDYPYLTKNHDEDLFNIFNKVCLLKNMNKYCMEDYLNGNAKRLFYKIK